MTKSVRSEALRAQNEAATRVAPAMANIGGRCMRSNDPPAHSVAVVGVTSVVVRVTRPGHAIAAVTAGIPGQFMAAMERAPIESAVHDVSVADGRVGKDVGTVRTGVMPGMTMMHALRTGRDRNQPRTQS